MMQVFFGFRCLYFAVALRVFYKFKVRCVSHAYSLIRLHLYNIRDDMVLYLLSGDCDGVVDARDFAY